MDKLVVACVQQRMRLPATIDEYRKDHQRFLRVAQNKHARLIVFPEFAGNMIALPMLADFRSTLMKRVDRGRRGGASFWQRVNGAFSDRLAAMLRTDLRLSITALLDVEADEVWSHYVDFYGGLAREFGLTVVAPGAYLPDPFDGVIRNLVAVFGTNGEVLGTQAKVILSESEQDIAQAGTTWDVIQTEAGRIGVMIGGDVLYPEVGRLLAHQNAEILLCPAAANDLATYNKLRSGMLARMQDNQLFGLVSFLVGHNQIGRLDGMAFVGKSAIFAPQELTPRYSGVLVEMGNQRSEGVLSAEWDFVALRELWDSSETPVRRQLPLPQINQVLARLYARLQNGEPAHLLEEGTGEEQLPDGAARPIRSLDELPVFSSITSRWPLPARGEAEPFDDDWLEPAQGAQPAGADPRDPPSVRLEDETDEMDALS